MSRPTPHPWFRGPARYVPLTALQYKADAEAAVAERPHDPAAWIDLGVAHATLSDGPRMVEAARKAVEVAPDDLTALRFLAQSLNQTPSGQSEVGSWYARIAALAPDDLAVLNHRYTTSLLTGDFEDAAAVCRTILRIQPDNLTYRARLARVLRALGEGEEARTHFAGAATLSAEGTCPFPHGPMASLAPVFTALAGDRPAAEHQSEAICRDEGLGLADFDHPRYPRGWTETLARAKSRVRGRDLAIFGNGPSLAQVAGRRDEIAGRDFLSMTMSTFQLAEEDILRPIGRSADFVCMTHPTVVKEQSEAVAELFVRAPDALLVLPLWVREVDEAEGFANPLLRERVLWYDCRDEFLAHPGEPLHVPALNTLLCGLSMAMLLEPRRIFLFGFDGGIKEADGDEPEALYYRERDARYGETARDHDDGGELTRRWLAWDSLHFNEIAPHALRHMSLLFDLPQPPIYNVCPGSALTPFPRITLDRFLEIVADGGAA